MKHEDIQKKILRYVDGDVSAKERQQIQLHLEQCEQCRKDVELLSGVWKLSQPVKRVQPSPFLWNRISAQLEGKRQREQLVHKAMLFIRRTAQPALTAVAVTLALFIGIQIGSRLISEKLSGQQTAVSATQSQNEFGLENFRVLSSGSLGGELAAFMDYEKE